MIRASISGLLWKAEGFVTNAKKEPAHSPTEDALIDALDSLIEAMKALLREAQ